MKIEDFSLFNMIVEYGSLSETARVLGVPASKLSRRMAQFEQHLGARLLERTSRGLTLTETGAQVLERSKRILAEMEEMEATVGRSQQQAEGAITVAAPLDFVNLVCRPALANFHETFPGLQLKFISYQSRQNPMEVQADLVLFVGHDTPPDCSMVARKLLTIDRCFVVSPDFKTRHPELVHPRQLGRYPCLLSAKGAQLAHRWLWSEAGQVHEVEVSGPLDSEINELCISAAEDGLGVAWVPPLMCQRQLQQGSLVKLFDGNYSTPITTWGMYSSRHYLPKRAKIVLDFFAKGFSTID
ncbi:DNA-binding transcriptional regulator, LysR family [Ferrimonas sediminum]|uniref:DNA-binding transcriptional regulator, LysR family n=1 Tax=Ferrimonas sediminum TaxID=718193 RepID=A0A1G9BTB6_9GAMM|nr:LysR family transcriptional regulator [Ferrimonas sediminum]SDK42721.1 DNA-binding transcriptional regulator, LysR family [Ferrimonas sediminum]